MEGSLLVRTPVENGAGQQSINGAPCRNGKVGYIHVCGVGMFVGVGGTGLSNEIKVSKRHLGSTSEGVEMVEICTQ